MNILKPPHRLAVYPKGLPSIFLAGSIENGTASNWQQLVEQELSDLDVAVYNPRRDDWDPTWEQSIHNEKFKEQVEWELDHIDLADIVLVYFDPNTKSPITLLELGILAESATGYVLVCCPNGFWRKGNVEIVCERYGIELVESLTEMVERVKERISELS